MKFRNHLVVTMLVGISLISSCKKEQPAPAPVTQPAPDPGPDESGQSSADNRDTQGENDAAINDINNVIGDQPSLIGRASGPSAPSGVTGTVCGMTVDTTGLSGGSVTLNFNGTTCFNRTRTGAIKITVKDFASGMRWKKAGCVIIIDYLNYKIVRASDKKSITLAGRQYLTNLTGGTWWELLITKTQPSIATSITGTNLKVTFNDGKTADYNIHRKITYTIPGGVITCTGEGIGSSGGLSSLENYGTTRDGDAFTSQVNTPIQWNLTCGTNAPVKGEVIIAVANKGFALQCTYGTDNAGTPVTPAANQCAYGWKLGWTYKGQSRSKVFGYN